MNNKKRSIRDIEIHRNGEKNKKTDAANGVNLDAEEFEKKKMRKIPINRFKRPVRKVHKSAPQKNNSPKNIWTFAIALLLFLGSAFLLYSFLKPAKAVVEIKVKTKNVTLSDNVMHVAYKDPEPGQLKFEVQEQELGSSKQIKASTFKELEEYAKGTVTVYNDYSSKPQRIIRNTRFMSPDGKIYRSRVSFTIPGKTADGPGSEDVTVYAEEAGSSYNLKSGIKMSLPALKGEISKKIYAVSKTDISGGFKGKRATISDQEKDELLKSLKEDIEKNIIKAVSNIIPDNYIFFKNAMQVKYSEPELTYPDNEHVKMTLKATAYTPIFDKYEFTEELVKDADAGIVIGKDRVYVKNYNDLNFTPVDKDNSNFKEDEILKFTVSGNANIKWDLDKNNLKADLAGKDPDAIRFVKNKYNAIESLQVYVKPVWKTSIPEDVSKIQIVEK